MTKYYYDVLSNLEPVGMGWTGARLLRFRINKGKGWWGRWSPPGFYYLMSQIEKDGLVESKDEQCNGFKRRYYRRPMGE